jgi:hypothetical protein
MVCISGLEIESKISVTIGFPSNFKIQGLQNSFRVIQMFWTISRMTYQRRWLRFAARCGARLPLWLSGWFLL